MVLLLSHSPIHGVFLVESCISGSYARPEGYRWIAPIRLGAWFSIRLGGLAFVGGFGNNAGYE